VRPHPRWLACFPAPTSGNVNLFIGGRNFASVSVGSVTVNNVTCLIAQSSLWTDANITCVLPEGTGTFLPVLVTVDGQISNSWNLSYAAPVVSSITPGNSPTTGTRLTINGNGFGTTASQMPLVTSVRGVRCVMPTMVLVPCDVL
jgi:hypothetical protein